MASESQTVDREESLEEYDIVPAEQWDRFHGKLTARLNEIAARVPDNYWMEVEYVRNDYLRHATGDRVNITIDSDEFVGNEGEVGDRRFHILLRDQGGLSVATRYTTLLGDERDYLDEHRQTSTAYTELLRDIKAAY